MFQRISSCLAGAALVGGLAAAQTAVPPTWASTAATEALDLLAATQQSLELPATHGSAFSFEVDLAGERRTLKLFPHSNRSADYKLLVQTDQGIEERTSTPKTYRGSILGLEGSTVAASLIDGQLLAFIHMAGGQIYGIQPLTEAVADAPRDVHVVYSHDDVVPMDVGCGTMPTWAVENRVPTSSGALAGVANPKIAEIACDSDFQYYQKLGNSVAAVENRIEAIVNGMQNVYDGEVGIYYDITTILVRTTDADPYSSTDIGTLLNQFQAHWNSTMGSTPRDVAHFFTGQTPPFGVIGVAYLNTLCNLGSAYGVVERFTTSLTTEVGLSAHEVGHNWSAGHCDGTSGCAIMCSGLGGCSGSITQFGPAASNQIISKKNSVSCLDDFSSPFPPQVFSALPNTVSVLYGTQVTVGGLFFNGTNQITLDGVALPTSAYDVASETSIVIDVPPGTAVGPAVLQIFNGAGASNLVTLNYGDQSPPLLFGDAATIPILPYTWEFGAGIGDFYLLDFSFDSTVVGIGGFDLLANPKKILFTGTLSDVGAGSESIFPGQLFGLTAYFQLLTFDVGTGSFEGASDVLEVFLN